MEVLRVSYSQCSRERVVMEVIFLGALSCSGASGDERGQMYKGKAGVGDKQV